MRNNNPYFIITSGVTGSGKTILITDTLKYLKIDKQDYAKILVDDLVENDKKYKKEVNMIIKKISNLCKQEKRFCLDVDCNNCDDSYYYNNPNDELYKLFSNAYFTVRKQKNCNEIDINKNCDELNDMLLKQAFVDKKNIILETTGSYIPTWVLNDEWITNEYNIVFSYSIVNVDNLYIRNIKRASTSINDFKKDNNKPAPRLPNVSRTYLKKSVKNLKLILELLYDLCILNYDDNKNMCGYKKINQLLIFDNNGKNLKLIFDSIKDKTNINKFIEKINPSFLNIKSKITKISKTSRKTKLNKMSKSLTNKNKLIKSKRKSLTKNKLIKSKRKNLTNNKLIKSKSIKNNRRKSIKYSRK
jgi:hypothetical protein